MAATIQFTNGTTTVDLTNTTGDYTLAYAGWMPKIARKRRGVMGGRSPYEDVVEEMAIYVVGTDTNDLLGNFKTLTELFDQANAWYEYPDANDDVQFQYKHSDATITISSVIWNAEIILPQDFTAIGHARGYQLGTMQDPIILRFTRRGLWLAGTDTKKTTFSTGNPAIMTVTEFNDDAAIIMPNDVSVSFYDGATPAATTAADQDIFVMLANDADKLYLVEAESMTNATSTAVTGSSAGSVHQQTDEGDVTLADNDFAMEPGSRLFAIYGVVKPSGTTTTWTLTAKLYYDAIISWNAPVSEAAGRPVTVDNSTDVQIINLGLISTSFDPGEFRVIVSPDANNSETINIDYFCVVALDASSSIIKIVAENPGLGDGGDEFKISHRLDDNRTAQIEAYNNDVLLYYPTYNNNMLHLSSGRYVSSLVFGGAPNYYVVTRLGTKELNYRLEATRTVAYLIPPGTGDGNIAIADFVTIAESVGFETLNLSYTDYIFITDGPSGEGAPRIQLTIT